jgi:NAD(P)-dependent dehydrogenase (short-subunit alcohol dehydrogenase family)
VVHGRNRDEAKQLGEAIGAHSSVYGDLGNAADCDSVINQLADIGSVEILINNAGIFGDQWRCEWQRPASRRRYYSLYIEGIKKRE